MAVDVRIIAATNKILETAVARKEFREDLYYRLHVIHLHLPPLRTRQEDIALLAQAFLARYSRALERPVRGLTPEAIDRLRRHPWPDGPRPLPPLCFLPAYIERVKNLGRCAASLAYVMQKLTAQQPGAMTPGSSRR